MTLMIGVVGYSGQKFDGSEARHALDTLLDRARGARNDVTIVCGLADVGIAAIAYRLARARGWETFAVDCARSRKYPAFPVDDMLIIESMVRGSESAAFLETCDAMVRVGGGAQAANEIATFRSQGGPVYEYDLAALPS